MTAPIVEDDYDQIPEALKERDQWLLWDSSAETPRRPHWDADFHVSWTDPNDWHSFEEAVELARANDSWGIGYVFSDLGPFTFVDLDGCLNADGEPKDWLPSIGEIVGVTYVETSASGTGLHLILRDYDEPEWWSDSHFSDDEHEGVEVYEQKFCAFTGAKVEESSSTVANVDITDWLVEAYKSINGEDPTKTQKASFDDVGDGGRANRDEFLDEDDIREALDHVDPDVSYTTWRDIGFALKDFFGSTRALSVYKDWSRKGTKWDSDAEKRAERIIKDATAGGGRTIGTVIHHAKQGGWEVPTPSRKKSGPKSSADLDPDELERSEAILESQTSHDDPVGDLAHHNGGYGIPWQKTDSDGDVIKQGVDQVCNFTLETLSFLSIEDQQHDEFKLRVHPNHPTEEAYDVRIAPSVFNAADTFRAEVVTGRTTWFDPSNRQGIRTITILRYLRETVGAQLADHRTGQPYIGLSQDGSEFVTPAGSLTADGWTDTPKFEYYSIGGDASDSGPFAQKWILDPDDEVDIDEDEVARICELLPNTRKIERGLPILGWFYAAPLKAHIHSWANEFPMLAPHGDTGTGKTSTLETYMRAFGGSGEPLSSTDTKFTKEKHLAESRGFPVWIDEYKPTEMTSEYRDHLHQRLKEVTKERTMPKGRPDLGIDQLHMRAPCILSGEQKISDAAVRRRSILTNLSSEPTRDGTPMRMAFGELTGVAYEDEDGEQHYPDGCDLRQHARAYFEWVLQKSTSNLQQEWNTARETVKDLLEEFGVTVEASEQRGLQTMVFGTRLAKQFANHHGADLSKLPSEDDMRDACEHVIKNIGKGGQRREHADEFLEALSLAATEGYVEPNVHHRTVDSQNVDGEVLAVHMPSSFTAVKRFVRESNLEDEYSLLSKMDYTNSFSNKADVEDSYVIETNKRTRKIENGARAVHFDHEAIREKLGADFNIDAFRPEDEREPVVEESEDETEADPVEDIADLEPTTSTTIEATAASVLEPKPWLQAEGTLTDGTAEIDFVARGQDNPASEIQQGERYRLKNVKVRTDEDGLLVVELRDGVSEIERLAGSGVQTGLERDQTATDGGSSVSEDAEGISADITRLVEIINEQGPMKPPELMAKAADRHDMSPDRAEHVISKAKERGDLYPPADLDGELDTS